MQLLATAPRALFSGTKCPKIFSGLGHYTFKKLHDDPPRLVIADGNVGMTKDKILSAFETFGSNDVPDDAQRYCIVGWKKWSDLLSIEEFVNADYVGKDALPFTSITQEKMFLGTIFVPHSGLPVDVDDIRSCFYYHKTAVGHAAASDVQTDVSWHGDRAAHFVNNMMS